jgi:DNA-binding transcriptional LysR family regulator
MGSPLTLEEYVAYPHLLTPTQADFRGAVDQELTGRSKRRSIIYSTSRFAALPLILQRAAVIAIVPEQSSLHWERTFGLTSSPVPVRIAPLAVSMIWHAKREGDAGLQWLRGLVRDTVARRMNEMSEKPAPGRKRRG